MAYGFGTSTVGNTSTGNNNIDSLIADRRWRSRNVTFSFTSNFRNDYEEESSYPDSNTHNSSFSSLNFTQRSVSRQWMDMYESVSGLNLIELTGSNDRNATLRMAESSDPRTAYAYLPGGSVYHGDIWFNRTDYDNPRIGNYAYHTFGHEIGHALGLEHGHEANGIRNVAMNSNRDSMEFSIMTYRSYIGDNTSGYDNESYGYAQSLMMYDIRAIQEMYGANFNHNSSNTIYSFSTSTGEMSVNGVRQGQPGANRIFRTIWDGNGIDTYDFSNYNTNLRINLAPGGWSDLNVGGNAQRARLGSGRYARGHVFNALQYGRDTRSLIENAYGGTGNDSIYGNSANNFLWGNAGNDYIYGYAGNDILSGSSGNDYLNGGTGSDTMYGGTGNDRFVVDSSGDQVIEYTNQGTDTVYSSISYSLGNNLENLTLQGSAYYGYGNSLNNIISGNSGANYLWGGLGGNDSLYGYGGNDILSGGSGSDYLNGGTGSDTMYGGTGNDRFVVDSSGDQVIEYTNQGTDTVYSSISYSLGNNLENLTLQGSAYYGYGNSLNNIISGNSGANYLWGGLGGNDSLYGYGGNDTLSGGSGSDYLNGGTGSDTMYGGTGNDRFVVDSTGDRVIEYTNQGTDTVYSSISYSLGSNLENLTLQGSAYYGYGNSLNNIISGNSGANYLWGGLGGNDSLYGYGGNDILSGGSGSDYLNGGTGSDTMYGGTGNDRFVVDSTGDQVTEYTNQGTDTVYSSISYSLGNNLENLTLQGSAYYGYGNSLNNVISGTNSSNYLWGGLGNDSLYGNGGNDSLIGSSGNDYLNGGTGNDYLTGGSGNDSLVGSTGADNLTGGFGADRFIFSFVSEGIDRVSDFISLQGDKFQISAFGFGGGLVQGLLNSNQFVLGSSATDVNDRFIYNQSTGSLSFDIDGSGVRSAVQFATLTNNTTLSHSDFVIV